MSVQLLAATLALLLGITQPTNYYSNYTSAKQASKASQKEMVILFSDKSCGVCESAWSAFAKDAASTQKYISTRMEADDFDGAVCFAYYELKETPSWVILTPGAEVKDKWTGGWKDAAGNPTLFDQSIPVAKVQEQNKHTTSSANSTSVTTHVEAPAQTKTTTITSPASNPTPINQKPQTGFVIQAGYFGSEANAQKLCGDLKSKGFANFKIETEPKNGSTFYRVISKTFPSEPEANAEQKHISDAGFKTSVKQN